MKFASETHTKAKKDVRAVVYRSRTCGRLLINQLSHCGDQSEFIRVKSC